MDSHQDTEDLSQERFGRFADRYVDSQTHAKGAELDILVAMANPEPGWKVLDVATGGGHTALKFSSYVREVVASDITPAMLAVAREFISRQGIKNVKFQEAPAESLPSENAEFDLVTCRIAAHHFRDVPEFLHEAYRVLVPKGKLLVQDHVVPEDAAAARYINEFERLRDPSHRQAFSRTAWVAMFDEAGFQVIDVTIIKKRHNLKRWAERQDCTPEVIQELEARLHKAPKEVRKELDPEGFSTSRLSFTNQHIIILGEKYSVEERIGDGQSG